MTIRLKRGTFNRGVNTRGLSPRRRSTAFGVVYFITCKHHDFPIKIGFATDLVPRIASVQTSLPYEVVVLHTTPGDRATESETGRKFEHLRIRGEWFERDRSILDYIAELKRRADFDGAVGISIDWDMPAARAARG